MTRILVVDDSSVDRRIASGLLKKQPEWEIVLAQDGMEALERLESDVPNLVVTDLQMPRMNGLELVERIREDYPLTPVVLMTAAGSESIAVQAIEMGAASYVPKKELANELVATVSRLLGTAAEQRIQRRLLNYLSEVTYVLQNDLELLSALSTDLRQTLQQLRLFDESQCLRFANAVDEALTNAYFHGNLEISSKLRDEDANAYYELAEQRRRQEPYRERRIYVSTSLMSDEVAVVIRDEGPGFDPNTVPDPTEAGFVERAHGRGLLLMRTFADDVRFNELGNEVMLVKRATLESERAVQ